MSVQFNLFKPISLVKKIITALIQTIILLVVAINVLLLLPPIQEIIRSKLEKEVGLLFGSEVSIGHINNMIFSNFDIRNITLYDLNNDTLLKANKIAVVLEPLSLLKGKIEISNCQLIGTQIHISKDSVEGPLNFQFLIDRFSSKDSIKKSFNYTLALNNIVIRNGQLSYTVDGTERNDHLFSPNHINLTNLNASIALKEISSDSLNIHIKRFSFMEHSGITLNNFTINAVAGNQSAKISNILLDFNHSKLAIDSMLVTYQRNDSLSKFINTIQIETDIRAEQIRLDDLSPFLPAMKSLNAPLSLYASISGGVGNININHLRIYSPEMIHFNSDIQLFNIKDISQGYIYAKVNTMNVSKTAIHDLFQAFAAKDAPYPHALNGLGSIQFDGELSGYINNFISYGHLHTDVGSLFVDLQTSTDDPTQAVAYSGSIRSSKLQLNKLIAKDDLLGDASFSLDIKGTITKGKKPTGVINGLISQFDLMKYSYKDIRINGSFDQKGYRGELSVDDENLDFILDGNLNLQEAIPTFTLSALFNRINPNELNLLRDYPPSSISFGIQSQLQLPEFKDVYGHVDIRNLFVSINDKRLSYNRISFVSDTLPDNNRALRFESPFLMAQIKGRFKPRDFQHLINHTLSSYLPSIVEAKEWKEKENTYFDINVDIEETTHLSEMFNLPFLLPKPAKLHGNYNGRSNDIALNLNVPGIRFGKTEINEGQLYIYSENDHLNVISRINSQTKKGGDFNLSIHNSMRHDSLFTRLFFNNTKESTITGQIEATTSFTKESPNELLHTKVEISPSQFIINDSIWHLAKSVVEIDTSIIRINHFNIHGDDQQLSINGKVSRNEFDTLQVELSNLSVDYIFDIIRIPNIEFGGKATGVVKASNLYAKPNLMIDTLRVKDFSFNKTTLGNLAVHTFFENQKKAIHFDARILNQTDSLTTVQGYYAIPTDSLELKIQANEVDVGILRPFIGHLLIDLTGNASGYIHLYGPTKYLSVEGKAKGRDVRFGVDVLGTRYSFSDSVFLRKDGIDIIDARAFDRDGNQAIANGRVDYQYFKDVRYNFGFTTNRLLVYDRKDPIEMPFGASVYASGNASIVGDEQHVDINASMRSENGSTFLYSINRPTTATNYEFITFVKPHDRYEQFLIDSIGINNGATTAPTELQKTNVSMNLLLEVNPNLRTEVIMDENTGDAIRATGNGNIRAEYTSLGNNLRLFGGYTIDQGSYSFSLQNVITKNFSISDGSALTFNGGDYRNIGLDVNAIYTTSANISDLDASLKNEISRTTLPVQCILKISGNLSNPTLDFDVAIPSVSSEINRRVKNIISSEDMMNRQIIYLLVLGKFYTPDYMNYSSGRNNEMAAIASSAVSSQLNNLLGKMIDNWNIGTNFRSQKGDFSDLEVELALSGQLLDNRLLINGNFGYRDKQTNLTQTSFIGDIDVEYKLTPSGIFRLKAYNHTNDRPYYYKPALTTQGLGFIFKKDIKPLYFSLQKRPRVPKPDSTSVNKPTLGEPPQTLE